MLSPAAQQPLPPGGKRVGCTITLCSGSARVSVYVCDIIKIYRCEFRCFTVLGTPRRAHVRFSAGIHIFSNLPRYSGCPLLSLVFNTEACGDVYVCVCVCVCSLIYSRLHIHTGYPTSAVGTSSAIGVESLRTLAPLCQECFS